MGDCLLDTNVLLFLANPSAPDHAAAKSAVSQLLLLGERAVLAAQTVYEFWSVATRPVAVNGLGWSPGQAEAAVDDLRRRFPVLPEPAEVLSIWLSIVTSQGIIGKRIHDAHLVATMKANGVSSLLTFNPTDFVSTGDLNVRTPAP